MDKTRRSREEVVIDAFRVMAKMGDLVRNTVSVRLSTGGMVERTFYKVKPNRKHNYGTH